MSRVRIEPPFLGTLVRLPDIGDHHVETALECRAAFRLLRPDGAVPPFDHRSHPVEVPSERLARGRIGRLGVNGDDILHGRLAAQDDPHAIALDAALWGLVVGCLEEALVARCDLVEEARLGVRDLRQRRGVGGILLPRLGAAIR